mmetsp:Transcript_9334/g.26858  ORF Transcript_9334/g.26858 Transcript_9334/m.26858 type:complete len:213 (-) Transcript_9334:398-1036(-)
MRGQSAQEKSADAKGGAGIKYKRAATYRPPGEGGVLTQYVRWQPHLRAASAAGKHILWRQRREGPLRSADQFVAPVACGDHWLDCRDGAVEFPWRVSLALRLLSSEAPRCDLLLRGNDAEHVIRVPESGELIEQREAIVKVEARLWQDQVLSLLRGALEQLRLLLVDRALQRRVGKGPIWRLDPFLVGPVNLAEEGAVHDHCVDRRRRAPGL